MTEAEREEVFYVSGTSAKGYTSNPAYAKRDWTGAPVIAPGHMKNLLDKQDRQYQRSLDVQRKAVERIWEALMDEMERYVVQGEDRFGKGQMRGLKTALALLEYGHDYRQDPKATLQKIEEMAQVRYDKESE